MQAGWWFCRLHHSCSMLKTTSMESYGSQSTTVPDLSFSSVGIKRLPLGAVGKRSRWAICSALRRSLAAILLFSLAFGILRTAPTTGTSSTSSPTIFSSGLRNVAGSSWMVTICSTSPPSSPSSSALAFGLCLVLLFWGVHRPGKWYISLVHGSQNVTQPPFSRVMTQVCSTSFAGGSILWMCGALWVSSWDLFLLSLLQTVPLHT
mmetsp:Transcript_83640/g.259890  ORF Transcript_83640/g.259890 Transcript_83640/m.259890 type:complete len:206 (-) Transcript_83640:163-780(-)